MSAINISTTVPVELALPVQNGTYLVTKRTGSFSVVDFVEYKDGEWQSGYPIITSVSNEGDNAMTEYKRNWSGL